MSLPSSGKLFNDPIHGSFVLHPLLVNIIDTPEFQRLRNIKQLGGKYYVFPGASHNRFEHCIGVCYLAGEMVEMLKRQLHHEHKKQGLHSDIVPITEQDVLCVKIAGLCHDLGHGPFSHVFDGRFIPAVKGQDYDWKHEDASEAMFDHMLEDQDLKEEFEKYELDVKKDGAFIKDLIRGTPRSRDQYERKRTIQKKFLFEIVANKVNAIDVDKWDYFARDSHSLGIPSNFDMGRTMHFARVIKCEGNHEDCPEGTTHICIRDTEVYNLYEMFHTRYCLHKRALQHKVALGVELMISDALVAANSSKYLKFQGKKGVELCMSETIRHMDAYIKLTDSVLDQILHPPAFSDESLKESQKILKRLQKRQLYKCVGDEPGDQWDRTQLEELCKKFLDTLPGEGLKPDDVHVLVVTFDYGMKTEDPIKKVLFYEKNSPNKAQKNLKKSPMLPKAFTEHHIRVYVKDENDFPDAKRCFDKWWKMQMQQLPITEEPGVKIKELTEENRKLREKVEKLQQELDEHKKHTESPDENRTSHQQESEALQADIP